MPVSKQSILAGLTPYWRSECGRATVYVGDCREVLAQLDPDQFHAVVTDPPYELTSEAATRRSSFPGRHAGGSGENRGFMGHKWDGTGVAFDPVTWENVLRAAKPGAHLLAFGGTRTWHRMACAIEDAGWSIRETLGWIYGSGFTKSHNISKAIDKIHGVDREVVGPGSAALSQGQFNARETGAGGYGYGAEYDVTAPATEDAKRWDDWGTSLKPAFEPIVMARKPFNGSTAQNTLEHGCGGLNIGACRVGTELRVNGTIGRCGSDGCRFKAGESATESVVSGRWPANIIHDGSDEVLAVFPDSKSQRSVVTSTPDSVYGAVTGLPSHTGVYGYDDSGSAARYFYTAKADSSDRPHSKGETIHPTVKPQSLMIWLVRLVCVRGGAVLDPFMGSGSTGCAALSEGMNFVGVEQSEEYADIAVGRLKLALQSAPPPVELRTRELVNTTKGSIPTPKKLRLE